MKAAQRGVWPPPVYVATFADGEVVRMSYHSRAGKPLDHERGRRLCCQALGNERGRVGATRLIGTESLARPCWYVFAPASDITAGHAEQAGDVIRDPYFAAPAAASERKRRPASNYRGELMEALAALRQLLDVLAAAPEVADAFPDEIAAARTAAGVDA